jgi:prepilin-type N-terminal cleavage/methylation domain-containing protein
MMRDANRRNSRRNRDGGFTLVELLVAVAMLGVATSLAFGVFGAQRRSYQSIKNAIEVQEGARLISDAMAADVRMAGYMVPAQTGITSFDGGANGPDLLCVSDRGKIDATIVDDANARLSGASVTGAIAGGAGSATLALTDIDGDGDDDFVAGDGIIIVDDDSSHCAFITAVAGAGGNVPAPRR